MPITAHELHHLYVGEKMSYTQIADRCGVSVRAVLKWMRKHDITPRSRSEAIKMAMTGKPWTEAMRASQAVARTTPEYRKAASMRQRGEKSHLWKGGKIQGETLRLQRYEWKQRRRECYKRDQWLCQDCGVHCTSKGITKIQAHHVLSRRAGGSDALDNLVTLCISCHHKREWAERKEVV